MKDKLSQLLENCTVGLIGDPELQLDVQAELKSHIEERIAEEKEHGADDEKSLKTALKAFGEVPEIADNIMSANKKRLNWRGKIRLAAMYLLIPLSIIAALISIDLETLPTIENIAMLGNGTQPSSILGRMLHFLHKNTLFGAFSRKNYTEEEKLILYGSSDENDSVKKMKAIWDKYPENKIYMGNYITELISKNRDEKPDSEKGHAYMCELRKAEKLDPENARYNYALADFFCNKGCELGYDSDTKQTTFKIKDRQLLDQGMAELKKGLAKPLLKTYSQDMLKKRLEIMGQADSLVQNIKQIAIAAGVLLPDLSQYRNLARIAPKYAEILIQEDKKEQALPYLNTWKILGLETNNDSFTLIEILVAEAIFEIDKELIPKLYEQAGHPELAEKYKAEQAILTEPVVNWKEARKNNENKEFEKQLRKSASLLTAMLLPALGEQVNSDELRPSRILDYIIMEKYALSIISSIFVLGMLACLLIVLRWQFSKAGKNQSILLLPNFAKITNIFLYGVILPVIAYYILSRLPLTGGRDFNLVANAGKWSIQVVCLFLALLIIPTEMTVFFIRKRFQKLGITLPKTAIPIKNRRFTFWVIILAVFLGGAILPAFIFQEFYDLLPTCGILLAILGMVMILNLIIRFFKGIFAKPEYSRYYSSVARTLIPVFAGTIILLVALTKPYVSTQETYLIQNDPLMKIDNQNIGFTTIECRLVKRLQNEIREAEKKMGVKKD